MRDSNILDELTFEISPAEEPETDGELILTPSKPEEHKNTELTLEAEKIHKAEEITFDGMAEAENRIEDAMKAYSAAMDDAAHNS